MSTLQYMMGRKKYARPQAMLWADNPGQIVEDENLESDTYGEKFYIPFGVEPGSLAYNDSRNNEFLILSDDNRDSLKVDFQRIETRERMANGRMRSYHIADKMRISTSWDMLPSRSFLMESGFNALGQASTIDSVEVPSGSLTTRKSVQPIGSAYYQDQQFTTDGGAGGVEMLEWYKRYTGSFWVYLSYDKYTSFGDSGHQRFWNLNKYSQVVEVFFDSFDYSVERRGATNHDFWNISVTLEEV
jgi:hypothetical protein